MGIGSWGLPRGCCFTGDKLESAAMRDSCILRKRPLIIEHVITSIILQSLVLSLLCLNFLFLASAVEYNRMDRNAKQELSCFFFPLMMNSLFFRDFS